MRKYPTVLRGRSRELAVFNDALTAFRAGGKPLVILNGPPGIGKRRIMQEFAAIATAEGFRSEWPMPAPGPDRTGPAGPDHGPTLIVLDDIQPWEQWVLIHAAASNQSRPPLCMLAPARDFSQAALSMAQMYFDPVEVHLGPLNDDSVVELAADLLGAEPDPDLADLVKQSGGIPSLAVELVRGLQEEMRVGIFGKRAVVTRPGLPMRLRWAVLSTLRPLHAPTHCLLYIAASQPGRCTVKHLVQHFDTTPAALQFMINEAVEAGLVRQDTDGDVVFTNMLLRQALRESVTNVAQWSATPDNQSTEKQDALHLLTPKQALVASMVAQGLTNQQAARRLNISTHTVSYHLGKIFIKLNISSRSQLSRMFPRGADPATTDEYPLQPLPRTFPFLLHCWQTERATEKFFRPALLSHAPRTE